MTSTISVLQFWQLNSSNIGQDGGPQGGCGCSSSTCFASSLPGWSWGGVGWTCPCSCKGRHTKGTVYIWLRHHQSWSFQDSTLGCLAAGQWSGWKFVRYCYCSFQPLLLKLEILENTPQCTCLKCYIIAFFFFRFLAFFPPFFLNYWKAGFRCLGNRTLALINQQCHTPVFFFPRSHTVLWNQGGRGQTQNL